MDNSADPTASSLIDIAWNWQNLPGKHMLLIEFWSEYLINIKYLYQKVIWRAQGVPQWNNATFPRHHEEEVNPPNKKAKKIMGISQ